MSNTTETNNSSPYRSSEINHLVEALSKAQGLYLPLLQTRESVTGKYSDLNDILNAVRKALSENYLAFYQYQELTEEGVLILNSTLSHSSGQFLLSKDRIIPGKNERQTGNIMEIRKRRAALLLLGIATCNDPYNYDDGGAESANEHSLEQLKKPPMQREIDNSTTITRKEYESLIIELDAYPEIVKQILKTYQISTLADLPSSEYHRTRIEISKLIANFKEYGIN